MTNAGKTFTISGNDEHPGLLPRTLASVFSSVAALDRSVEGSAEAAAAPRLSAASVVILVSYLEVYNENCFDLLGSAATSHGGGGAAAAASAAAARVPRALKDGRDGNIYARGLRHVQVKSAQAALEIMREGATSKCVAETQLNADSSRSHTVFSISMFVREAGAAAASAGQPAPAAAAASSSSSSSAIAPPAALLGNDVFNSQTGTVAPGYRLWSRINIVDLAGSERQSRTMNSGARLREAGAINSSLMTLMKCFETMRANASLPAARRQRVPFRESKLTRLFGDSLGGHGTGSTIMVVNACPSAADFDETLHALKYGALVKDVRIVKDRMVKLGAAAPQYGQDGRRIARADELAAAAAAAAAAAVAAAGAAPGADGGESTDAATGAPAGARLVRGGSKKGAAVALPAPPAAQAAAAGGPRKPVAPAPIHGPQPGHAAAAAAARKAGGAGARAGAARPSASIGGASAKVSIGSIDSSCSFISTSRLDAALRAPLAAAAADEAAAEAAMEGAAEAADAAPGAGAMAVDDGAQPLDAPGDDFAAAAGGVDLLANTLPAGSLTAAPASERGAETAAAAAASTSAAPAVPAAASLDDDDGFFMHGRATLDAVGDDAPAAASSAVHGTGASAGVAAGAARDVQALLGEWAAEKSELLEHVETLTRENDRLASELEDAQADEAAIEAAVREEVAAEMAIRIAAVESEYHQKMAAEAARFQERINKLMTLQDMKSRQGFVGGIHQTKRFLVLGTAFAIQFCLIHMIVYHELSDKIKYLSERLTNLLLFSGIPCLIFSFGDGKQAEKIRLIQR